MAASTYMPSYFDALLAQKVTTLDEEGNEKKAQLLTAILSGGDVYNALEDTLTENQVSRLLRVTKIAKRVLEEFKQNLEFFVIGKDLTELCSVLIMDEHRDAIRASYVVLHEKLEVKNNELQSILEMWESCS